MSDTSVTTEAPALTPPPQTPLPNDQAARSPTGEILEPSQIATKPAVKAGDPPVQTSTSTVPELKPADAKPSATTGAPEAYTDFTAPEGYTLDKAAIDAFTPIAKELGLSQEQAQKLVGFHTAQMIEAAKAPAATYEATRTAWQAQVRADPDLAKAVNGDKTGLDAVKLDIGRALTAIGDPVLAGEFKSAMDLTGAGDHPAFVKTLWKLAQFATEGKHVTGTNPSPHGQQAPGTQAKPTPAAAMYPNLR
jgi:hypothetical protein